jgi:hypothetical protein
MTGCLMKLQLKGFYFSNYKLLYVVNVYFCHPSLEIHISFIAMYRKAVKLITHSCCMRLNCTMLFREGVCVRNANKFNFIYCYTPSVLKYMNGGSTIIYVL